MKRKRVGRMVRVIGIILCGFLLSGLNNMVYAESAKDILNQINKEIRKAERDMFSGKIDKAIASLDPIRELFGKVKKADPNNPKIKTMENKFNKLVKDLERRTGKDLSSGTVTGAGADTQAKPPTEPETETMPAKTAPAQPAGDADTLAKETNKLLRQAEKNVFAGKNEEAEQQLDQVKTMIDKIKADDPNNSKLASLESKYGPIQKKLDAKKLKDTQQKAASAQSSQAHQASTAPIEIPYKDRQPLQKAKLRLENIEKKLAILADPSYSGTKDSLIRRTETGLSGIKDLLEKERSLAAEKDVTSHPDFDEVAAGMVEAEKKLAQVKIDCEEEKAIAAAQSEEVNADVKALLAEYNRVKSVFEAAIGVVIY